MAVLLSISNLDTLMAIHLEAQVAICLLCHSAIGLNTVDSHYLKKHRIPAYMRRQLFKFGVDNNASKNTVGDNIQPLPDGRTYCKHLPTFDGFSCSLCPFKTINRSTIRMHQRHTHNKEPLCFGLLYEPAILQRWYQLPRALWWKVTNHNPELPDPKTCEMRSSMALQHPKPNQIRLDPLPIQSVTVPDHASSSTFQQEEQKRRALVQTQLSTQCLITEQMSSWQKKTQWNIFFHGRPIDIIYRTAYIKRKSFRGDYVLGTWKGLEIISTEAVEHHLNFLMEAVDGTLERCLQTLNATP
ncbi:hypothetical protein GP486_008014 [Trichoglossum hirsutum]|uniref:C2H2-type domain-containing protein n=1 Tax=Trichoglossum hirsutum TaxID=265104 RepID=A0A9P8IES2_9PEZI|nr:hypothetical protein GP486_008014 [Trichoglossum hirsutum]